MNVLFVSSSFPRPGLPAHCPYNVSLCRALARTHDVTAIVPVPWTDWSWGKAAPAVEGTGPRFRVRYARYYHVPRLGQRVHDRAMWRGMRPHVDAAVTRGGRPDWMLSYWTYPDSAAALRFARELRVPLVSMVGGSDVLLAKQGTTAWRQAAETLQGVDHVITVSDDLAERICALGVEPSRVTVMPRGVDTDRFKPGSQSAARTALGIRQAVPMLLWVGRMVPVKNLETLLEAAQHVAARGCEFLLYLVGDGPSASKLRRLVRERGLERIVHFVGHAEQPRLAAWYQASDVFMLPSWSEGTPNVLLEALACGKPFIASRVGGIPMLADPAWDQLVTPSSPRELADAIEARLRTPGGVRVLPHFLDSWDAVAMTIRRHAEKVPAVA